MQLTYSIFFTGAKYGRGSGKWSINIGPASGGFLPILNVKSQQAELSSRQRQKRNKSASTRRKPVMTNSTNKSLNSPNTASILDLNSISSQPMTTQHKFAPRLHRESSLPLHLGTMPPMLKYSDDSQNDFFLSRLALIENANRPGPSPEPEALYTDSLNSMVIKAGSRLTSTPIVPANNHTADNTTTSKLSVLPAQACSTTSKANDIKKSNPTDADSRKVVSLRFSPSGPEEEEPDSRWQINIRLPGDEADSPDENSIAKTDKDSPIKGNNDAPKSILKPKLSAETPERISSTGTAATKKQTLELSTYVLMPPFHHSPVRPSPTPPTNSSTSNNQKTRKRRFRLKELSSTIPQSEEDIEVGNELSCETVSSPTSANTTLQLSDNESPDEEIISDIQKSVRFCEKPAQVKEYFPWEAPQDSILI